MQHVPRETPSLAVPGAAAPGPHLLVDLPLGVTVAVLLAWLVLLYADPPWDLEKGR